MSNNAYVSAVRSPHTMRPVPICPVCTKGFQYKCIERGHIQLCTGCTATWCPQKQLNCPHCLPIPGEEAIWDHYYMVNWFLDHEGEAAVSDDDNETISDSGSYDGRVDSDVLQAAHALVELSTEWRQAAMNKSMGVASLRYSKATQEEIRYALQGIQNPKRRGRKGKTPASVLARDRSLAIGQYVKLIYKTLPPVRTRLKLQLGRSRPSWGSLPRSLLRLLKRFAL